MKQASASTKMEELDSDTADALAERLTPTQLKNALSRKTGSKKTLAEATTPASQSGPESNAYASLSEVASQISDKMVTGWGPDRLQPTDDALGSSNTTSHRDGRPAPHMTVLSYSRRIEGLLEPTDRPTLEDVAPCSAHNPIATLAHGLDRVLFNPGVHWLQDPRSRVYNFPPHIEMIPRVNEFAFERLPGFIKSSSDEDLWTLARQEKRTYAGSTSSLGGMLAHIYFLLSSDKEVNVNALSAHFAKENRNFTPGQRMPASVILNYKDGVYAIDSDSSYSNIADKNILTWMGTMLEKLLTSTPEEFAPYMRFNPGPPKVENPLRDAYRYAKSDKFVMRSQLDCYDPRLPGTGVFDIKTRACLPIRMDLLNFEENSGYLIRSQMGKVESFEKEYYDLVRAAFLKYSFQVRIGNMDGVIVAYHNTARMFGFQYVSLPEMDQALFGKQPGAGDRVFAKCVGLLEKVVEEIAACFPGESVKATFEKPEGKDAMNVWVQPVNLPEVTEAEAEAGHPTPIKQLVVTASNFLGQDPVRGSVAVGAPANEPWTTHWTVSRLATSEAEAHAALEEARTRQFRFLDIPTGWDEETVGAMWAALNFGGLERNPDEPVETPTCFRMPQQQTQMLRQLARQGAKDTARQQAEEAGQPKVWLGGMVEWNDLREVQEKVLGKEMVSILDAVPDEMVDAEQQSLPESNVDGVAEMVDAEGVAVGASTDTTTTDTN
ncbi:hypothetical protein H0H92_015179 [Tricholoma furcatifolium]|nr:hypothetical protein H0H92_015179 [Tricholoma furcatifolium]